MGRIVSAPVALALATAGGVACAGDQVDSPSVVTDSAGVRIVENNRAAWGEGEGWSVAKEPLVEIGRLEGPAEYQLYRAFSAVRLSDGGIVVANGGTNELRYYDSTGEHRFSAGRTGEGPGEFGDLQNVWALSGDSLLAYDFGPSRLSVFSPAGEFARSFHIAAPDGRQVLVRGPLGDGSVIVAGAPIWSAPGATSGIVRDSVPYYRYDPEGSLLGTLGVFPSREVFRLVTGDDWRLTSPPFPRAPIVAVAGDRFHFGAGDAYAIESYTPAGELERVVRLPHARRPVTAEDIDRFRSRRLERAEREGTRPAMERMLRELPYPEVMPPHERAVVDADENLWVADYRASRDEDPSWKVFASDGRFLGTVMMPARLEVLQIGRDFVLGRWVDDLDVERIRVHALSRGVVAAR